jgi:hypothetical protein
MWRGRICGADRAHPRTLFTKSFSADTYSSAILPFIDQAISQVV